MNDGASAAPAPAWSEIGRAIDVHSRFLISTHVHPDGDGLGAELGLWGYLRSLGKDVRILNPDPLPERYRFLDDEGQFEVYDPVRHAPTLAACEAAFVLDVSRPERLGTLGAALRGSGALMICVDHHPFEGNGFADLYGVDVNAAATGQLIYELIRGRGHSLDRRMAIGLYVSILTDTGSFRFANSDRRAHIAAAELLDYGLDPAALYENVYGNWSLGRLQLLGETLTRLRSEEDGAILVLTIPRERLLRCGVDPEEAEGFIDVARTARASRAVALLLETEGGAIKTSLRSKGSLAVNTVAARFGGGGHRQAAGAILEGPLDRAAARILAALREALRADREDAGR